MSLKYQVKSMTQYLGCNKGNSRDKESRAPSTEVIPGEMRSLITSKWAENAVFNPWESVLTSELRHCHLWLEEKLIFRGWVFGILLMTEKTSMFFMDLLAKRIWFIEGVESIELSLFGFILCETHLSVSTLYTEMTHCSISLPLWKD